MVSTARNTIIAQKPNSPTWWNTIAKGLGSRLPGRRVASVVFSMCVTPCGLFTPQSPMPGFRENKLAFSGLSSQSFASAGGSRFIVMFGHSRAYSALMRSHFSRPASVSGLIAYRNQCIRPDGGRAYFRPRGSIQPGIPRRSLSVRYKNRSGHPFVVRTAKMVVLRPSA
jgi:hypothetical protein